jgi:putative glutamine amidotransferase
MTMASNSIQKNQGGRKPFVLMSMGAQDRSDIEYQVMATKYMSALVQFGRCHPILIPTCFDYSSKEMDNLLDLVDGVYLSGASTNMNPSLYGQENLTPEKRQDRTRDIFDVAIVRQALERGLPVLGVCRGMQEINVAYGGTLHQKAYALDCFDDHREDADAHPDLMYGEAHEINLVPGTWFHDLFNEDSFRVNSLHGQALDKLGEGLSVLAYAPDGLIEAIYAKQYPQFSLAVQWHPEWKTHESPHSIKIFKAFGDACYTFMQRR